MRIALLLVSSAILATACSGGQTLPEGSNVGADPKLPAPQRSLIPTVDIAPATGWPDGVAPTASGGLAVTRFADGLDHPRWLLVLPNDDVLVAESNGPPGKGGVFRRTLYA